MISRDDAIEQIRRLPQFRYINKDAMGEWLDAVEATEPARMEWHIRRLGGLGGTDLGEIVTHVRGGWGFRSLDTVVAEKLMAIPPAGSNEKMRRGIELEEVVRRMFHEQTGAVVRDDLIRACLQDLPGEFGFIRSNPDDVVEIPGIGIYLPDYKCPDEPHHEISINYQTQLQVYDYKLLSALMGRFPDVSELHEIRGDRPALSCDAIVLVSLDYKNWRASPLQVDYDMSITSDALANGKKVWDAICRGQQPKLSRAAPERFALSDATKERISALEARWAAAKVIADQADKAAAGERQQIEAILADGAGADVGASSAHAGAYAKISAKAKLDRACFDEIRNLNPQVDWDSVMAGTGRYDAERIIEWAIDNVDGFDVARFEVREPDEDKLNAICREHGIKPPFESSYTMRMNTGKKAAAFNEEVVPFVSESVKNLRDMTTNVMAGRDALHGIGAEIQEPQPIPPSSARPEAQTPARYAEVSVDDFFGPKR